MFGSNATSPETVGLQLLNEPINKKDYARYLVQRISEAHKLFASIKKDLRRGQREYYDLTANPKEFIAGQPVLARKPPPSNAEKGLARLSSSGDMLDHTSSSSALRTVTCIAYGTA